ncbi:hypothetical protein TNCV_2684541 [Trichonephila clavipes]|nr:hypothetical protein TNCV_2684541 [Trichonephila clavipes]
MFKLIADPADLEVRSVIRFLNTENVKPVEIHRQLVEVYGENVMSNETVKKNTVLATRGQSATGTSCEAPARGDSRSTLSTRPVSVGKNEVSLKSFLLESFY